MTDKIKPALSAEEWANKFIDNDGSALSIEGGILVNGAWGQPVDRPAAVIALANAALPDDDPRKITRERVAAIRHGRLAYPEGSASWRELTAIADALASYLPPPNITGIPDDITLEDGSVYRLPPVDG